MKTNKFFLLISKLVLQKLIFKPKCGNEIMLYPVVFGWCDFFMEVSAVVLDAPSKQDYFLDSWNFSISIAVKKYDWVVNGEARKQIDEFMSQEHSFEEYCNVRERLAWFLTQYGYQTLVSLNVVSM